MRPRQNPEPARDLAHQGPVPRAGALLRLLATGGRQGVALSVLAAQTGLPVSTVHRLLAQLVAERLAAQLEGTRAYALGPLAFELGVAAAQQFDMRGLCRPILDALAVEAAETVYLVQRSGVDAVCLDVVQGPTAVRVGTLQVGSRRPLGLGAGGLAILAALPAAERTAVLDEVQATIEDVWRFPAEALRDSLEQAARTGTALIRNRISAGVTATGRAFSDSLGRPLGAVSIAGTNARMTAARLRQLDGLLRTAAARIEQALRGPR